MRKYKLVFSLIVAVLLSGGSLGCDNRSELERGVDNAVDDVKDATN